MTVDANTVKLIRWLAGRAGAIESLLRRGGESKPGGVIEPPMYRPMQLCKVNSAATGGGKYLGLLLLPTTTAAAVAATGNLSEADVGVEAGGRDALILNLPEVGKSTHDLTSGTPSRSIFPCVVRGWDNENSRWVVVIDGYDFADCE